MAGKTLSQAEPNSQVCFSTFLLADGIGVHTGEFLGVPPTGKSVEGRFVSFDRIEGDKVVSAEIFFDVAGLLIQLGAMPPPKGF